MFYLKATILQPSKNHQTFFAKRFEYKKLQQTEMRRAWDRASTIFSHSCNCWASAAWAKPMLPMTFFNKRNWPMVLFGIVCYCLVNCVLLLLSGDQIQFWSLEKCLVSSLVVKNHLSQTSLCHCAEISFQPTHQSSGCLKNGTFVDALQYIIYVLWIF